MTHPAPTAPLPAWEPAPPPRRWPLRTGIVALGVLLAIGGALGGAWLAAPARSPRAAGLPSSSPTAYTIQADPSPTRPAAASMTVVRPKSLLGRLPSRDRSLLEIVSKRLNGVSAAPGETWVSGAYGSLARRNAVAFWAATTTEPNPSDALQALSRDVYADLYFHDVEPGSLGGAARCADAGTEKTPVTLCMWADSGTVGLVFFMFKDAPRAVELLAEARGQIEAPKQAGQ